MKERVRAVIEHVEIEPAVIVIIRPDCAAGVDIGERELRRQRRDREAAIAIVSVQDAGVSIASHVKIKPAVAVIVAPGLPDAQVAGGEVIIEELPVAAMRRVDAGGSADIDEGFELANAGEQEHAGNKENEADGGLHWLIR